MIARRRIAAVLAAAILGLPAWTAVAGEVVGPDAPVAGTDQRSGASPAGIPERAAPVVDLAGVLDDGDERFLTSLALSVRQKTGAEMAVLTVRTTAPLDDFSFGMKVAEKWKLGSADEDNGLLLLVAVDDHHVRFFQGYGLEGILPDGRLGQILDTKLLPAVRAGDLPAGVRAAMTEVARIITAGGAGAATPAERERDRQAPGIPFLLLIVIFFILMVVTSASRRSRVRRRYPPVFWGGGFGGPMGGGFGGGFGGGGGGGFGGGGGGFGGGGAGRSW